MDSNDAFASSLADRLAADKARRHDAGAWRWCGNPDCDGLPHDQRGRHARFGQRLPDPGTRTTYLRGGRGSGKSWSASHIFADWLQTGGVGEWGVVGRDFSDARSMAIESPESGLLSALGTSRPEINAGHSKTVESWNRSLGELTLRNGSRVHVCGADNGALRLQGKNLRGVWADEIGLWTQWDVAWDESIRMATRIEGARIVATGTPKKGRKSAKLVRRLIDDPNVDNRLMRTTDNSANLSKAFLDDVTAGLTRKLALQELEGQLLDESEDALWRLDLIDAHRVTADQVPQLELVVVALDPAVTANEDSDETGIIVAGKGVDGHGYVLADLSFKGHPAEVARRAVVAYETYGANWIVAEVNNGGDYIGALIKTVDPNVGYRIERATRGKYLRAEPVAALYERGRMHHVGVFDRLEDQQVTYEPGTAESPDRLDALVYAAKALKIDAGGMTWDEAYSTPEQPKPGTDTAQNAEPPNPWTEVYG
jgi:phage terminase large subunit-like protein